MSLQNHYKRLLERIHTVLAELRTKLCSSLKMGHESSLRIRRRQFFIGGGLALGISIFVYGVMGVLRDQGPLQKQATTPKPVTTNIATAISQVDMGEARWHNLDEALNILKKEVSELKKEMNGSEENSSLTVVDLPGNHRNDSNAAQNMENDQDTFTEGAQTHKTGIDDPRFEQIQERLAFLEAGRDAHPQHPVNTPSAQDTGNGEDQNGRVIHKLSLGLVAASKNLKTVETTIPSGAFAKTVLLSGLDASSAMNASSDPRPMLLRIIDHGTLPRRFQSDLKDCHCTAGAYGDLSSERVYARLEKLTCIERATGEIIETHVSGYVAGSDGKAGIRGIVASRDGQFLARSLMGGIFSGLSNVANPQNRRAQVNPFFGGGTAGSEVSGPSMGENFMSGMSSGATTALDRLSQYYIDRAEQLQPVIQIAAGQVVDIVFTMGTFIGSQSIRSESEKTRDNSPSQNHPSSNHERN